MDITSRLCMILRLILITILAFSLDLVPLQARAQDASPPVESEKFSKEELAQMLAPIALYPDKLLSQILIASTYPIEVIEADRWVKNNQELQGDALDQALLDKEWDASVKSICHFPTVLSLMSERIAETTELGNAFLAQEAEVMDMIQQLRTKAYAEGNLANTPEQEVTVDNGAVIIEPTDPGTIYVPYYNPYYVYGPWWYPAYSPYYWGPPGVTLGAGIWFWPGIYFGYSWGSWGYFNWPHHYYYVHSNHRPHYVKHGHWYANSGRWQHAPTHRRGVAYRDKSTASKYGQYPHQRGVYRSNFRGFPEQGGSGGERHSPRDERFRMNPDRRVTDSKEQRSKQEQQRIEQQLQTRKRPVLQQPDANLQRRTVVDRAKLSQEPTGQRGASPAKTDRVPRVQKRVEQEQKLQQRRSVVDRAQRLQEQTRQERQESTRMNRTPQVQRRIEQEQPLQRRVIQGGRERATINSERPQRQRETVFDVQENDRNVHQSRQRGQFSRQGQDNVFRNDSSRGGRGEPGRSGGNHSRH